MKKSFSFYLMLSFLFASCIIDTNKQVVVAQSTSSDSTTLGSSSVTAFSSEVQQGVSSSEKVNLSSVQAGSSEIEQSYDAVSSSSGKKTSYDPVIIPKDTIPTEACVLYSQSCLTADYLSGRTFSFPENLTHIVDDGLNVCQPKTPSQTKGNKKAAILYIVDQSNSMNSTGDPWSIRGEAVKEAIKHQRALQEESIAGVIEFAASLDGLYQKELLSLNNGDHYSELLDSISAKHSMGTNYHVAFTQAKQFIDALDLSEYDPYVLFITDGDPNVGSNNEMELIDLALHLGTIHVLHMNSDYMTDSSDVLLRQISGETGGSYYLVNSGSDDALEDRLLSVVEYDVIGEDMVVGAIYTEVTLRNVGTSHVYTASSFLQQGSFNWEPQFDSDIPLEKGLNQFEMDIDYSDEYTESATFTIEIEEGVFGTETYGSYFELVCE